MSDYWAKRQTVDDAYGYFTQAENTADEIGKVYQKASGYISNQADDIFQRYRTRYNLSEAEARRLINTLRDQTSIDELLKKLQSVEQTEAIMDLRKEIEASAFAARLERLRQLQNNLNLVMRQVYQQELKAQTRFYTDLANEAYYRSMFRMQQQANAAFTFNLIDENAIDRVLNTNWSGKHYSTRIWNNTQGLAQTLKRELLTSLVTGRPQRDTAQIIANKFAVGANAARRLVRTETNYVSGEINALAYKDAGVEEYQFLATLDLKTSQICREHDGRIYKLKDRVVGENFPPLHPWCRSTTVSVIDRKLLDKMTRSAIDPATGKRIKVPRTMDYNSWYNKYVKGHKEVEAREKAIRNRAADQKQYEEYKKILGEDVPKTFEEFQKLKYENSEKWAYLKGLKGYLSRYPNSDKRYYNAHKAIRARGINQGVLVPAKAEQAFILPTGKRDPYHIMHRMLERNITDDAVRGYMKNARAMFVQWGGSRRRYESHDGVCVITKTQDSWLYKTAWTKHDFDEQTIAISEELTNAGL